MDHVEIEARGEEAGLNPMFGNWTRTIALEPVSCAGNAAARRAFTTAVRAELRNRFIFVGEIKLSIDLHLNEQKMLATPDFGDLCNHAKQLLDTLKGDGGLFIDDCQVENLEVGWMPAGGESAFLISIEAGQDDFLPLPVRLYEMPDGLLYPLSEQTWTPDGPQPVPENQTLARAHALAELTGRKRALRHDLRQDSAAQLPAARYGRCLAPVLMGFHPARVAGSGFEVVPLRAWRHAG
jgi:Holliday junction resolvase RusA-like endonuclease